MSPKIDASYLWIRQLCLAPLNLAYRIRSLYRLYIPVIILHVLIVAKTFYCNDNIITEFEIIDRKNFFTAYVILYKLIGVLDSTRRMGVWSFPWRWHILFILLTVYRGTADNTCALYDVFPPDALYSRPETLRWYIYIYTSGQRYGITTTKWHLREFGRYLLLLVVCSIAERNVDFIDPLRNQMEWPNTVSIVWGPLILKIRKSEFRGSHLKWSLPSLLPLWCFYAAWGFGKDYWYFFELLKGMMPQNLPEQILQRIGRLSADGNLQREVARMLGGLMDAFAKLCNTTERLAVHIRGRVEVRWKSTRQGKTANGSELSEQTTSSWLLVCQCRWSADLGGGCHFEPFRDGIWPLGIGFGVQPDVLGSLQSTGDATVRWEEAQSVGPQTMETLYLQWWVPVLPMPQWWSGHGAP